MKRPLADIRLLGPLIQTSGGTDKQDMFSSVDDIVNELNIAKDEANSVTSVAYDIVDLVFDTTFTSGKKNNTLAAVSVYSSVLLTGEGGKVFDNGPESLDVPLGRSESITQDDVADIAGVAGTTIREWYNYTISAFHLSNGYTSQEMYGRSDFDDQLKNDFSDLYNKARMIGGL